MYKILLIRPVTGHNNLFHKYLRVMKLCLILVFAFTFQSVALPVLGQNATIKVENAKLPEVFKLLKQQTGYDFLYMSAELQDAHPITLNMRNQSLKNILDKCFENTPFTYQIQETTVIVKGTSKAKPLSIQNLIITGTVVDQQNNPIPGTLVSVKGSTTRVATNSKGIYRINVPAENSTLVFSFIGFVTQEVAVNNRKLINITLAENLTTLNQVVVVGYGTVNKKDLTGSVGEVKMDDLVKAPVSNFDQALAGRVAGVTVSANDGQPGNDNTIVIRGGNSLTQSNAPLYVIDGFPMEDFSSSAVSPEDIASISILKDASATAIYGSRGANGVIVIETKKGVTGKPVIAYKGSLGFQQTTNKMDMLSAYEFVKYQEEIYPTLVDRYYTTTLNKTLEDYRGREAFDWQDMLFRTAPLQIHNLALRGGNAATKYSISGNVYNQEGIIVNTRNKRYQGRISVDQTISKKLKGGVSVGLSNTEKAGAPLAEGASSSATSYGLYRTWGYRPVAGDPLLDLENILVDPETTGLDLMINPVINAKEEIAVNYYTDVVLNSYLTYELAQGLVLKVTGGLNSRKNQFKYFYNSKTSRGTPLNPGNFRGIQGGIINRSYTTWVNENTITYKKRFNKDHYMDVVGGFTMQDSRSNAYGFEADNILAEELGFNSLGSGTPYRNSSAEGQNRLASFLGRVNYNYKSKYLFTITMRADGSSKFKPENRWGYFPSAAVGWKIKEENFLKNSQVISNAKVRASYGITGNNRVGDFDFLPSVIYADWNGSYSFENAVPQTGAFYSGMGNDLLKWETTAQTDIGVDVSFFKNRIDFSADIYRKVTTDLLLLANMPRTTGFAAAYRNIGSVQNQGLELTLNTINVKSKNFTWESNFNIAFNSNKILSLSEGEENIRTKQSWENNFTSPAYIGKVGQPAALFYGYIWDGNYQFADFDQPSPGVYRLKPTVATNGNSSGTIQPGDIKYRDVNGDLVVNSSDLAIIGRPLPIHVGGFHNNFTYKNLSLGVLLQWSYGNDILNANRLIFEGNGLFRPLLNQFASYADRWTPENQSNTLYRSGGHGPFGAYSSRVIEDGSYLRLKTVSMEYKLPAYLSKKVYASSLSLNIAAQNLWTWTNYTGMDPEVSTRNSALTPGFDYSAYPIAKTIVFGISANF